MPKLFSNQKWMDLSIILLLFLFSTGLSFSFFILKRSSSQTKNETTKVQGKSTQNQEYIQPASLPQDRTSHNILILGHGDAGHQGGNLTDAILVAHFDTQNNIFSLISIPRDIWVKFPNGNLGKVNSAFAKDSETAAIAKKVDLLDVYVCNSGWFWVDV